MSAVSSYGPAPDPSVYFGQPIIPVATITIALSTLFVGMRFWSRAAILRAFALEDGFIFLGWFFAVGTSVCNLVELKYGLGRQYAALDPDTLTNNLKTSFATNVVYVLALLFVKVSILCLYIRVLTYDSVRLAAKVILAIVVITHIWIVVSVFTGCVPLTALWDLAAHSTAYCHPGSVYWSHSGLNITTDFLIFLLPLPVLRKLSVPRRQKIVLYCVFLLAFCICIISLLRTVQFIKILIINPTVDTTQDAVIIAIWTMLEVNMAVVCACVTTIKPVLTRFFPRVLSPTPGPATDDDVTAPWSASMEQDRARPARALDDDTPADGDSTALSGKEATQPTATDAYRSACAV